MSIHHKIFSSIILCVTLCGDLTFAQTQLDQHQRFEREHRNSEEIYSIINLNKDGLALLKEKNKFSGNKKLWELTLLDTALQERKVVELYVEERYPLIGYEVTQEYLYLLYRTGENPKSKLLFVEVDLARGTELMRQDIRSELEFQITHFSKAGSSFVLGGYVSNDPAILLYDLQTKSIKVVPGFFIKDSELVDVRVNQNQTFNIVLIDRSNRTEQKIVFKTFDESGNLLLEDIVPIGDERTIQHCISSTLEREELILLGTWGDRQSKQASGFFSLVIDPFSEQEINYYHFGELDHFLDHMNPKRAEKIKSNTKESLQKKKTPTYTSYVMPYSIRENKSGFVLLAEVYNPVSVQNPYYTTPYGNPYYYNPYYAYNPYWPSYFPGMRYRPYPYGGNGRKADEFKILASAVLQFDAQGKLVFDHSMKLEATERVSLDQVTDFYFDSDKAVLFSRKEGEIVAKAAPATSAEQTDITEKVKLKNAADEFRHEKETENGVKHWYGNVFYVWGYQTIRNMEFKEDRVRDVFYINKMVVR